MEAVFEERGLLPWHDFAEGPDWFGVGAWRAYLEAMQAGGMNRLLLHNYNSDDHRHYGAQPITWYGNEDGIGEGDAVLTAYPAWQWTTQDGIDSPAGNGRGEPRNATAFDGGSGRLFTAGCFGSPLQSGRPDRCPYPTPADSAAQRSVFSEAAAFFREAVMQPAAAMGIRVAVAVGVPLSLSGPPPGPSPPSAPFSTVPRAYCDGLPFAYTGNESNDACRALCVARNCSCYDHGVPPSPPQPNGFACRISVLGNATHASGWNYTAYPRPVEVQPGRTNASIVAGYRGMLARMRQVYGDAAVDTLVLWAQIQGTDADWRAVAEELELAQQAASELGWAGLKLATGGWQLGPTDDPTYINRAGAANVTMMQLLGGEGTEDVDGASYSKLHASGRGAWTVPWLEGDLALLGSQLWVQRTLRQAQQAQQAGASGNLAIHWRTAQVAPQLLALQGLGWRATRREEAGRAPDSLQGVYEEYARQALGLEDETLVQAVAAALVPLDGNATWTTTPVPWVSFGLEQDCPVSQAALDASFAFVNASLVPLLADVAHHPQASRGLSYWVGVFEASYHTLSLCLQVGQFEAIEAKISAAAPPDRPAVAQQLGLPALQAMSAAYDRAVRAAMATLETTGDLGVISELGTHTYFAGPNKASTFLQAYITVPSTALPAQTFAGPLRAAALNHASTIAEGSPYVASITVAIPTAWSLAAAELCWQPDAAGQNWTCQPLTRAVDTADVFETAVPEQSRAILAFANITAVAAAGTSVTQLLPPTAPAQAWHIEWQRQ